jgi:hypothetical protein
MWSDLLSQELSSCAHWVVKSFFVFCRNKAIQEIFSSEGRHLKTRVVLPDRRRWHYRRVPCSLPDHLSLSPGLEWRFHFRGAYFGLRDVMENATSSKDPVEVNNVVVSPQYGTVSEFLGRAFTARIRLIGAK